MEISFGPLSRGLGSAILSSLIVLISISAHAAVPARLYEGEVLVADTSDELRRLGALGINLPDLDAYSIAIPHDTPSASVIDIVVTNPWDIRGAAQFANGTSTKGGYNAEIRHIDRNCAFYDRFPACLVAITDIEAGEEIVTDYGNEYSTTQLGESALPIDQKYPNITGEMIKQSTDVDDSKKGDLPHRHRQRETKSAVITKFLTFINRGH